MTQASAGYTLPEKVLQFGAGVLLRALPDYFIDKANRAGIFSGTILVVKTTGEKVDPAFALQDNLYTLAVRGIAGGQQICENTILSPISRVLHASTSWSLILEAAHNKELKIIISNTTEEGISYVGESIFLNPPHSYPAKLLAFLFERFKAFGGTIDSGMVILPTELLPDNAARLKAVVLRLAGENKLGDLFAGWLSYHNYFCNTLVDRIVPGKPDSPEEIQGMTGYRDELLCVAEPYCLWAIEGGKDIAAALSFHLADERVVITPNIQLYRELKLRLLNGTHILGCGVALLSGFETVSAAMADPEMAAFLSELLLNELAPAIPFHTGSAVSHAYGLEVLDRFRNPGLAHKWVRIATDHASKLRIRVVPVLKQHYKLRLGTPRCIALGFAAWCCLMRDEQGGDAFFTADELAAGVLGRQQLWETNLNELPGFSQQVQEFITLILSAGIRQVLVQLNAKKLF